MNTVSSNTHNILYTLTAGLEEESLIIRIGNLSVVLCEYFTIFIVAFYLHYLQQTFLLYTLSLSPYLTAHLTDSQQIGWNTDLHKLQRQMGAGIVQWIALAPHV